MKSNPYTLIELVAVLAIIILISSVVTVYVKYAPSFVSLDTAVNKVEGVLQQGGIQSLSQGRNIKVVYSSESRKFQVQNPGGQEDGAPVNDKTFSEMLSYTLAPEIEIEFPDADIQNDPEYVFYPDGSASGPPMLISLKGHCFEMKLSPLTGTVRTTYVDK